MAVHFSLFVAIVCLTSAAMSAAATEPDGRVKRADDSDPLRPVVEQLTQRVQQLEAKVQANEHNIDDVLTVVGFTVRMRNEDIRNLGRNQVVKFDDVIYNAGNGYSASSGIFTAPVPGTYVLMVKTMRHGNDDDHIELNMMKNGALLGRAHAGYSTWENGGSGIAPSYMERWQAASTLLSQAKTVETENILSAQDRTTYEKYLDLSPSQIRQAVLDSVRSLRRREGNSLAEQLLSIDSNTTEPPVVTVVPPWLENATVTEMCLNHTAATVMALTQKEMWALQMVDAMGKLGPALLLGNLRWPGAYDECVNVRAKTDVTSHPEFSGQYCDAVISLDLVPLFPGQPTGAGTQVFTGLCVPDTCADWEMTLILSDVFIRLGLVKSVYVSDCRQREKPLDTKANVAITICSILLALMAVGTVMDVLYIQMPKWRVQELAQFSANTHADYNNGGGDHRNGVMANGDRKGGEETLPLITRPEKAVRSPEHGTCTKLLVAFSVYTNGTKQLSTHQPPGSLTCIHGIRFLSMTWVVLGHTFLSPMQTGGKDGHWLTPAYMLVIMVYVCLSPYWGKGPLWPDIPDRDFCENNWWTNLLYINNIVRTKEMCLAQSWYLANDMQFYILSPLIFVPLFFSQFWGMMIAAVFFVATTITPAVLTVDKHYPTGLFTQTEGQSPDAGDWAYNFYMKPYTRMGAYIVGMLAGYFLYNTDCKLRINKVLNLCIWAVATAAALAVLYGLFHTSEGHPMPVAEAALYNAVHRQVWSLCVAWVIVACVTGNGGFVNTILSWPALVPLSRLTYCIYLLHFIVIETYMNNGQSLFYMNDVNIVMLFLAVLVVSYMAAFVTSLAFEAPMMGLEKILFHNKGQKTDKIQRTQQHLYAHIPTKTVE
ncbi:hypothetical protein BaRGS_00012949 [Batillaria attramentaria]|uniref:C1q domain-containing protein n=1 Tax=Batillaria attramentaria TaxID=370345 RepID=A0ABD0L9C5_9CAEN